MRLRACRRKHHSLQTSSNEKEIRFQSAFFKLRVVLGVLLCFAAISIVMLASRERRPEDPGAFAADMRALYRGVMPVVKFDVSPPLRSMKPLPVKEGEMREDEDRVSGAPDAVGPIMRDPVVQRVMGRIGIPGPIVTLMGRQPLRRLRAT